MVRGQVGHGPDTLGGVPEDAGGGLMYAMRQGSEIRTVIDHYIREVVMKVTEWDFLISNTDLRYFGENLVPLL
jgi:hypothetical protein